MLNRSKTYTDGASGDQCYELWNDDYDVETISFHETFDKDFFQARVIYTLLKISRKR